MSTMPAMPTTPTPDQSTARAAAIAGAPTATLRPAGNGRSRCGRRLFYFPCLMLLLVGGAGAVHLRMSPPHPESFGNTSLSLRRAELLSESQARHRAQWLCARLVGPEAEAVAAQAVVNVPAFGRTPIPEWQVDCRTSDGPFFVRLEAATGQVLSIAPETLRGPAGDGADRPAASGKHAFPPAVSPARAEVLARRYLKRADLALPPPGLAARPELRWFAGPLNPSCSVTFRPPAGHGGMRADWGTTLLLRVDMDARDGSLHGLYRFRRFE